MRRKCFWPSRLHFLQFVHIASNMNAELLSQNMLCGKAEVEGVGRAFYENTSPYIAHIRKAGREKSALNFPLRNVARLFICQNYTLCSLVHISLTAVFKIKPSNCLLFLAYFLHFLPSSYWRFLSVFFFLLLSDSDIPTIEQMKFYTKNWQSIK